MARQTMTVSDLIDGPPIVPVWPTGGQALLMGRARTYEQARSGHLAAGVPVLHIGQRLRVRRSDLLRYLGVVDPHAPAERSA